MNINKQYVWRSADDCRENNPLLPRNLRGLVIGKSGCGETAMIFNLLLQRGWLDYNHLYVFGKCLHQQEYKVLRKRLDAGLSKQHISNLFNSQNALGNIPPLTAIENFSGVRNGKVQADFYDDCQGIPDPSALDPTFRHKNCDTIYIAQNYFRLPRHTIRENSNFIILSPQDVKNLIHIHADHCASDIALLEFKQFCHRIWSNEKHNLITIDLTSTPMDGKYRQNFNRFYFPTGTI